MIRARFAEIGSFSEKRLEEEYLLSSRQTLARIDGRNESALASGLAARALLRELLSEQPETAAGELFYSENGKPLHPYAFVSLSHSGKYAAAAVSDSPVGVDIEDFREITPRKSYKLFCEEENRFVNALEEQRSARFLFCWTRKEAFIKLGDALLGKAGDFNSLNPPDSAALITARLGGAVISVCVKDIPGAELRFGAINSKSGTIFG